MHVDNDVNSKKQKSVSKKPFELYPQKRRSLIKSVFYGALLALMLSIVSILFILYISNYI